MNKTVQKVSPQFHIETMKRMLIAQVCGRKTKPERRKKKQFILLGFDVLISISLYIFCLDSHFSNQPSDIRNSILLILTTRVNVKSLEQQRQLLELNCI